MRRSHLERMLSGSDGRGDRRAPTTIGVVGLGYWGPNLLRVLHEHRRRARHLDLRPRPGPAGSFRRRYPAVSTHDRLDDCSRIPILDAIVIATPVFTHFELASQALQAGKHTFVEKPLAPSSAQADELIALARCARARAHVRPHLPVQPAGARGQAADRHEGPG